MELRFEETTRECLWECLQREEKCRVDVEGVVPDINVDVGRVISVQSSVLLKAKEVSAGEITLDGELETVVLYITESADAVSHVRLSREFRCAVQSGDAALLEAQAEPRVLRTEARVLNPRKLAVSAEIGWELRDNRSTVAAMEKMNEGELVPGRMLLIPRA